MKSRGNKIVLKKVIKAGKGLSIFITKEARRMGLEEGDYVSISIGEDSKGEKITIRKAKIM